MAKKLIQLKRFVAALSLLFAFSVASQAQEVDLDDLFTALKDAGPSGYEPIEEKIWQEWSKSGSKSMDYLLKRGRDALSAGRLEESIGHFSALIDHAPDFAEGYNARATAYFMSDLYGPSLEDIRKTLELNPRHFGAISGLASILEALEMKDAALKAYREVEAIHPHREGLSQAIERLEKEVEGQSL